MIDDPSDRKRRVERAVDRAILAAIKSGLLETADAGAYTLARELARTIDYASSVKREPYAVATASRELREVLAALKLTPASRAGAGAGELEQLLEQLLKPTTTE